MIERLPSGIPRLDGVLAGGLAVDSINLIIGVPGSGKTILAQRYAFTNGTAERPALYLSTVSEPLDKIVRFGQTMSFFDVAAVGTRVLYEALGQDLDRGGLPAVLERIQTLVRERRPALLVIDSFKALTPYAADDRDYRSFLHQLAGATLRWINFMSSCSIVCFSSNGLPEAMSMLIGTTRSATGYTLVTTRALARSAVVICRTSFSMM